MGNQSIDEDESFQSKSSPLLSASTPNFKLWQCSGIEHIRREVSLPKMHSVKLLFASQTRIRMPVPLTFNHYLSNVGTAFVNFK